MGGEAFFWELPPLSTDHLDREFVCAAVPSPSLREIKANPQPFASFFYTRDLVVSFLNLGGDAKLIAPTPSSHGCDYAHMASFLRTATQTQQLALWARLSVEITQRMCTKPMWISTSGLGVYWLHVRLDEQPKYYTYTPYKYFP